MNNNTTNNFKINFYNNIELAISAHAEYIYYLSKALQNNEGVEEEIKVLIDNTNQALKLLLHRLHLQINSLDKEKTFLEKEKELYKNIKIKPLINEEEAEEYLLLLNKFLLEQVGDVDFEDVARQL